MVQVDSPVGYPKLETPHSEDDSLNFGGREVRFGRVRKMTDG
jgi:hypothetical protein